MIPYTHILMKKTLILITSLAALTLTSCQDMGQQTKRGAATGAVAGGVLGGIIGHQSGRATEGALLGAAAGAAAGGAYGSTKD